MNVTQKSASVFPSLFQIPGENVLVSPLDPVCPFISCDQVAEGVVVEVSLPAHLLETPAKVLCFSCIWR